MNADVNSDPLALRERVRVRESSLDFARRLRRDSTDAENKLWRYLRNRHFLGLKFRRQYAMSRYLLDFYCHECSLAIEVDGGQHFQARRLEYDKTRAEWLQERGLRTMRFTNLDVH